MLPEIPEMLRIPWVELCLQIKLLSLGNIKPFLLKALEPPREESINMATALLYEVGAKKGEEESTPLGYHLAKLPVDVLIGKMMLYGGIFGCLSPILTISAVLSYKSPFVYPKDEVTFFHLFTRSFIALRDMRIQFGTLLADIGLINLPKNYQGDKKRKEKLDMWFSDMSKPFNLYSNHTSVVKVSLKHSGSLFMYAGHEGGA